MLNQKSVAEIVRETERDFISGTGTLMSDYVTVDLYTDINTIYAYLNSKHISGSHDSLGREKPFFNIVKAARNIHFRATDIDRKDIVLVSTKMKDVVGTFLLAVHLQDWMRKEKFGKFLNTWGLELAGFNSSIVKFVEKGGRLTPIVMPWSRMIVDQVNFDDNAKIEILELTEAQMYQRYDKDQVKAFCDAERARETTGKKKKDNKNNYYKLYEVHGMFELSQITNRKKDKDTYVQQMHVVSFVQKRGKLKEYDEFTLYKGREEKDPYMLTSLLPETDGSISLNGSVKNLFEAQWMTNHTAKSIKDQLDLASKLIFQTSDQNYVGQNALFAIESGDILVHKENMPLTKINNDSHDITSLQNFGADWKQLGNEINGISDAMLGAAPKAGTAWRQTEALLQESHSLFEIMTENKGLAIEEMLREFIIPFLKKKMNNANEVAATLDMHGIKEIEDKYIKNQANTERNRMIKDMIMNDENLVEPDMEKIEGDLRTRLTESGNLRFFKPDEINWKEELKDIETNVEIIITGESKDVQQVLTTLNSALLAVANPNYANNPKAQLIVDKILTATGQVSPLELSMIPKPASQLSPGGKVDANLEETEVLEK